MRSESQKEADKRYKAKLKAKGVKVNWQAEISADEAVALNSFCKANNISKPEFLRRALALMSAENS